MHFSSFEGLVCNLFAFYSQLLLSPSEALFVFVSLIIVPLFRVVVLFLLCIVLNPYSLLLIKGPLMLSPNERSC